MKVSLPFDRDLMAPCHMSVLKAELRRRCLACRSTPSPYRSAALAAKVGPGSQDHRRPSRSRGRPGLCLSSIMVYGKDLVAGLKQLPEPCFPGVSPVAAAAGAPLRWPKPCPDRVSLHCSPLVACRQPVATAGRGARPRLAPPVPAGRSGPPPSWPTLWPRPSFRRAPPARRPPPGTPACGREPYLGLS